jgi:hypothetical protein
MQYEILEASDLELTPNHLQERFRSAGFEKIEAQEFPLYLGDHALPPELEIPDFKDDRFGAI